MTNLSLPIIPTCQNPHYHCVIQNILPACHQWSLLNTPLFSPTLHSCVTLSTSLFLVIFPPSCFSIYSFFPLPFSLSLFLFLSLSGWTGTEPTNTAIKRTPVWVWKHYQGLPKLTLPLHTLTWIDAFVCTLCVQPTTRHLIHRQHYWHLALWINCSDSYNIFHHVQYESIIMFICLSSGCSQKQTNKK